jgi:hypothetical protein
MVKSPKFKELYLFVLIMLNSVGITIFLLRKKRKILKLIGKTMSLFFNFVVLKLLLSKMIGKLNKK